MGLCIILVVVNYTTKSEDFLGKLQLKKEDKLLAVPIFWAFFMSNFYSGSARFWVGRRPCNKTNRFVLFKNQLKMKRMERFFAVIVCCTS